MSRSKKTRRHYTTEQKVAILKRQHGRQGPGLGLCNELELQPSVFYQRQRQVFEAHSPDGDPWLLENVVAAAALRAGGRARTPPLVAFT